MMIKKTNLEEANGKYNFVDFYEFAWLIFKVLLLENPIHRYFEFKITINKINVSV